MPMAMTITRRRGAIAFFLVLGICSIGTAVLLNIGWVIVNARRHPAFLVLGIVLFILMISGMVVNTIFLVREIRRNERQESFLNAVTHELKTPIASVRLYLETLKRVPVDEEQRQEFYNRMLEDNDRLLATVEQILRAGEISHRKANTKGLPIDMRALVQSTLQQTLRRHHLQDDAIQLQDNSANLPLTVIGHADDLQNALLNVFDNAVKYSPSGVAIRAEINRPRADRMNIRITDKGIGIPPAMLTRIFERFYRVTGRDAAKVKGTGLGLFIVRAIARRHGGNATAQSFGMGKGTTITLELPLASTPAEGGQG